MVGRLRAFDRRQVVLHDLLVGLPARPPALHVRALKPLVQEGQVLRRHRSEAKLHCKGIIARRTKSDADAETVLATSAAVWGVLMGVSPALQIRKMLHHRSSHQVSIAYFWVLLVGFTLWVAYGLTIATGSSSSRTRSRSPSA